jgi:putative ABC transport system permease protein
MDTLLQDLRFALRSLRRTPGYALAVVVMMALGIGVNAMIYSVLRAILFRDLPFTEPNRIVKVDGVDTRRGDAGMNMSLADTRDVAERVPAFSSLGVWVESQAYLTVGDEPMRYGATVASEGLAPTLGVAPALGRWFRPEECRTGANLGSVVLADHIWRDRFGADPAIVGRALRVNGRERTVVGVMPVGFRFPESSDFFLPLAMNDTTDSRGAHYLDVAARLAPGATPKGADGQLRVLAADLARQFPLTNQNTGFQALPLREAWIADVRPMLLMLGLAVTFVLLIACANVANLMLVRATARVRELGVRLAMGATRGRIVRQLLTESVLLALVGGALGILLGEWGMRATLAAIPVDLPYWMHFELDPTVVASVAAVSLASGILFGFAPAWQVTSGDVLTPLREGTPGGGDTRARRRVRDAFVVAEVALAVVLLVASGLMVRSFLRMQGQRDALRTDHVLTGGITLPAVRYGDKPQRIAFFTELRQALRGLPGVREAGGVLNLHLGNNNWTMTVQREGIDSPDDPNHPELGFNVITPGYLSCVGLTLVRGRDFTEADGENGARVAIVNEAAALRLWPGQNPIGRRLRLSGKDQEWLTVVGVTANVRQRINARPSRVAEFMIPYAQWGGQQLIWAIRTEGDPGALAAKVRSLLRARDPDLPFYRARTMREHVARSMWDTRLYAQLMAVFSVLALLIAALGIYGVMAYSVSQRTREIGIRMALGAARVDVQRLVFGQASRLTALGMGIGLAAAFGLTKLMSNLLFGVRPDDPPTFVTVTLILAASAVFAAWLPAARAVRVDPVVALRHE